MFHEINPPAILVPHFKKPSYRRSPKACEFQASRSWMMTSQTLIVVSVLERLGTGQQYDVLLLISGSIEVDLVGGSLLKNMKVSWDMLG